MKINDGKMMFGLVRRSFLYLGEVFEETFGEAFEEASKKLSVLWWSSVQETIHLRRKNTSLVWTSNMGTIFGNI